MSDFFVLDFGFEKPYPVSPLFTEVKSYVQY